MKYTITVDTAEGQAFKVDTDGYVLLYLEGQSMRSTGKVELNSLAPMLAKLALERMTKSK